MQCVTVNDQQQFKDNDQCQTLYTETLLFCSVVTASSAILHATDNGL